jgi:membrane protease YdiL (CAAX protease family)
MLSCISLYILSPCGRQFVLRQFTGRLLATRFGPLPTWDPQNMKKSLKNPMVWFFVVAFGLPWLGWSSIKVFGLDEPSALRTALFYTGDFCSVAGLVAMYLQAGKAGVIDLLKRCVRVNVSPLWWLIVIILPFAISFAGYLLVGALGGGLGTIKLSGLSLSLVPPLLMAITTGPLGEELGWRGYLTPKLLETQNAIVASLVVGFLWGIWHLPLYFSTTFSTLAGGLEFIVGLMLTSIIMTAILLHTRGSVLLAVLYHWMMNVSGSFTNAILPEFDGHMKTVYLVSDLGVQAVVVLILIMVLGKDLAGKANRERSR